MGDKTMGSSVLAYFVRPFKFEEISDILIRLNEPHKFQYLKEHFIPKREDKDRSFGFYCSDESKSPKENFEERNFLIIELHGIGTLNFTKSIMTFNSYTGWGGFLDFRNNRLNMRNLCYELSENLNLGPAVYMSERYDYTEKYKGDSLEEFLGILKTSFGEPESINNMLLDESYFDKGVKIGDPIYFVDDFSIGRDLLFKEKEQNQI
jgi:hypothetical protein